MGRVILYEREEGVTSAEVRRVGKEELPMGVEKTRASLRATSQSEKATKSETKRAPAQASASKRGRRVESAPSRACERLVSIS